MRCRLDELGAAHVESPAVIVIGAVAALDVTAPVLRSVLAAVPKVGRAEALTSTD